MFAEPLEPRLLLAAGAVLVKDIVPDTPASSPSAAMTLGNKAVFTADDGISGREMWVTDGTPAGTSLLRDIMSGSNSSFPTLLGIFNNAIYFSADNGTTGTELWRTDGTTSGTTFFKDVSTGSSSSAFSPFQLFNGAAYFLQTRTGQLWKTDGTSAGTVLVDNTLNIQSFTVANNALYLIASSAATGTELWRSDGTAAGKVLLEVNPGAADAFPAFLTPANGLLFFRATDATGYSLWKTDGTPQGTTPMSNFAPGPSSSIAYLTNLGGTLLFRATTDIPRLWRSDGTPEGTYSISDFAPTPLDGATFQQVNGAILFKVDQSFPQGIWKSDGTADGTALLVPQNFGQFLNATTIDNTLYYKFFHDGGVIDLWKSDGTAEGTTLVSSPFREVGRPMGQLGTKILYSLADHRNLELWQTDGTAPGTTLIKDINSIKLNGNPRVITNVNGTLFFVASNAGIGHQVWKSDGTDAGTVPIATTFIQNSSDNDKGINFNGLFIFSALNELWRSDGTAQGTFQLGTNIPYGSAFQLFAADGYVLYAGTLANSSVELWRTDGTIAGTRLLMDLPGTNNYPTNFVQFNGSVYFTSTVNAQAPLWKTDGTPEGTVVVNPKADFTRPVVYKNRLYFSGCDAANGCELWSTDGNGPGSMSISLSGGSTSSTPKELTVSNGYLYFTAQPAGARDIYKSDGTQAGTSPLGFSASSPGDLTDVNGTLFFEAISLRKFNGATGNTIVLPFGSLQNLTAADGLLFFNLSNATSLWVSDGSDAGTRKLLDHPPGVTGSSELFLATLNGEVFFRAIDPAYGTELFKLSPPTARSTGPYMIGQSTPIRLDASASSDLDPTATLTFAWDLDNDNIFGETGAAASRGDEIGPTPTFQSSIIGAQAISLRITSSTGLTSQLSTFVNVRGLNFLGTSADDNLRVAFNTATQLYDIYENSPPGAPPTFSIRAAPNGLIFDSGAGNDTLTLDNFISFTYIAGPGTDSLLINSGNQTLNLDAASRSIENITLSNAATLLFTHSQHLSSLVLNDSSASTLSGPDLNLRTGSLALSPDASLNLTTNVLIIDTGSLADVTNLIKTGLTSTHGIRSSSTLAGRRLGVLQNFTPAGTRLYPSFAGEFNLTTSNIFVLYTLIGDLNLDKQVTISDFIDLASHFNQSGTWGEGDINYDGVITVADFIDLAANFNQSFTSPPQPALSATISTPLTRTSIKSHRHAHQQTASAENHAKRHDQHHRSRLRNKHDRVWTP